MALRELSGGQLFVLRRSLDGHEVRMVGADNDTQSTIRLYPEAFLAGSVIVCEGPARSDSCVVWICTGSNMAACLWQHRALRWSTVVEASPTGLCPRGRLPVVRLQGDGGAG